MVEKYKTFVLFPDSDMWPRAENNVWIKKKMDMKFF